MNARNDDQARELANRIAQAVGLGPLTKAEAEQLYRAAQPKELTDDQIRRLVEVTKRGPTETPRSPEPPQDTLQDSEVEDSLAVMHRNEGREDPEVTRTLEELREEMLDEEDEAEDHES
jgi:hypothetical protein